MCILHTEKHRRGRYKWKVINKIYINNKTNEKKYKKGIKIGLKRIDKKKKKNLIPI